MATNETLQRISISIPEELVKYADQRAEELSTSRSQVIVMALSKVKSSQEEQLAAEGYRYYAAEAGEFAAASGEAVAEAWTSAWTQTEAKGSDNDSSTR